MALDERGSPGPVRVTAQQDVPIDPVLTTPLNLINTVLLPMHLPNHPNTPRPDDNSQPVHRSPEGRTLNVTDALSYLDAVKIQFQDNPDVYNQFLDIMKDFKSQMIDTPGVIQRVSRLFHGNPTLIQGFNTFLPLGYRIEVSVDPSDPNAITVTTPQGTTTQSTTAHPPTSGPGVPGPSLTPSRDGPGALPPPSALFPAPPLPPLQHPHPQDISHHLPPHGPLPGSRSMTPHAFPPHPMGVLAPSSAANTPNARPPFIDPIFSPGPDMPPPQSQLPIGVPIGPGMGMGPGVIGPGVSNNSAAPPPPSLPPLLPPPQQNAAAEYLNGLNPNNGIAEKNQKGDFNNAITYLNKIKARYQDDDQNTYKQFLDILQTYHKEAKHTGDTQVYAQVQALFADAQDLLVEFKAFLPEAVPQGLLGLPPHTGGGGPSWPAPEPSPPAPPAKKPVKTAASRRKRPAEKEATPAPAAKPVASSSRQVKKVKHHHNTDNEPSNFYPPSPPPAHAYVTHSSQPHMNGPAASTSQIHPNYGQEFPNNASSARLLFFDRAKKNLETRDVYEEFLKFLDLFSRDILDVNTLIERSAPFFKDSPDLMAEFKDLMGYDDRDKIEKGPPGSIRTGPPEFGASLVVEDGEGPSYRKLPLSEKQVACSGRDQLCRSVLNDTWVSHPTWASEESGFLSHKKTAFEEALHKSEEERYEYQVHLQALARTIALLEPINARIDGMGSHEERSMFRLKANFGGPSPALYHRVIKRVFGKDVGNEVIQALQDSPSIAVPVVLNRLKSKDEEWRRAQREWSRTWKEIDSKNFYKSLDHQGINFKQTDKKTITAKHFVADILTVKKQQARKWEKKGFKHFQRGSAGHQLEFSLKNGQVVQDALKMVYSFLERSPIQYNSLERRAVEKFLNAFVPVLFATEEAGAAAATTTTGLGLDGLHLGEDEASSIVPDLGMQTDATRSGKKSTNTSGTPHSAALGGGIPANDLRKKLLKTAQEKAFNRPGGKTPSAMGSRAESPSSTPGGRSPRVPPLRAEEEALVEPHDIWIKEASLNDAALSAVVDKEQRPFFCNTTFYTLFRLLELLYSRLLMCYEIGAEYAAQKHAPLLANPVAVDLGLDDPNGPASVLAQTAEHLGKPPHENDANIVYMYLLTAADKFFDGELDGPTFDEHMRWFFGTKAYTLSTLDKLIPALIKQVQIILSDHKCQELWSLLKSAQSSKNITTQDIVRYRREAERHVGQDDHLYRLQWVRDSKCMRVQLCSTMEPSAQTDGTAMGRWRAYTSTYVMSHPTEWLPEAKKGRSPVYLQRCVRSGEEGTAPRVRDSMKIRISMPRYKLVYEAGSEDVVWHDWGAEHEEMVKRARGRDEERRSSGVLR